MNTLSPPTTSKVWYREPWPWFLISLPATAVVAGLASAWLAYKSADGLVVGDYYTAGKAINHVLARDDAAHRMMLNATLESQGGILSTTLKGRLQTYPDQLSLALIHPTRQGQDQTLNLIHAGNGLYRAALPAMPAGKWHLQLADHDATWRLVGVLHTPFSQPVTLTTDTESTVQSQGD